MAEWGPETATERLSAYVFPVDHPELPQCVGLPTKDHNPRTCTQRGKHPCVKFTVDAVGSPREAAALFAGVTRNYGINCARSRLLVLDEDVPGAIEKYAAERDVDIPPTFTVKTGRPGGGRHYYFRLPGPLPSGSWGFPKGVDIKAGRAYVVGPGSLHASGARYEAENDLQPAACPQWILNAFTKATDHPEPPAPAPADVPPDVVKLLAQPVGDGDRSERFHSLVGACRRCGMSEPQTVAVLTPWCQRVGKYVGRVSDEVSRSWGKVDPPSGDPGSDRTAPETTPRRLALTPASRFSPARVKWGWANRMPVGELTLIPGREGVGKSLFLAWQAAQITRGTLPGEFYGQPRAVLYVASEDSWRYTITPRLMAAGADVSMVYRVTVETGDAAGRLSLPVDCRRIPGIARQVNAAALMLDPIVSLVHEQLSVNQSNELRRALEPLRDAAEEAGIIVPALVHFNKAVDTDVLSKIPGGRAWAEVARAAFALAHDRENRTFVGSQIKNNLGRLDQPNLTYTIDEVFIETPDGPTGVGRLSWTGETNVGVDEVLSRKPDRHGRGVSERTADVVAFVDAAGYAMPVADIAEKFPDINRESLQKLLRRAAVRRELSNPLHGHYGPARGHTDRQGVSP